MGADTKQYCHGIIGLTTENLIRRCLSKLQTDRPDIHRGYCNTHHQINAYEPKESGNYD